MSNVRISNLFAVEDWRQLYTTFNSADFQSYDYETLRKSMVTYLRTYYPEDFNDYIESSEFVALLDLISFMGQSLSFRGDLNYRENFIQTAERRDSIYRMANMLGYSPNRNRAASGLLKITSLSTSETLVDSNGVDIRERRITWNDPTNPDWQEQFSLILNSAIQSSQKIGRPQDSIIMDNIRNDHYEIQTEAGNVPLLSFSSTVNGTGMPFNVYNLGINEESGIYEKAPQVGESLGFLYRTDGEGNASANTGFFVGFKQGRVNNLNFTVGERLPNRIVGLNLNDINNDDVWLFETSDAGGVIEEWEQVQVLRDSNIVYNDISAENRKIFSVFSRPDDQVDFVFGDGVFSEIPVGNFTATVRNSNGLAYSITPSEIRDNRVDVFYVSSATGRLERLSLGLSLQYTVNNASTKESLSGIKVRAPQSYYTQNRMVNGEDYNTLPYVQYGDIVKVKAVNRTSSGISRFLDLKDVTGKYSSTNIYCEDGYLYAEEDLASAGFDWTTQSEIQNFINNSLEPVLRGQELRNLYYSGYSEITVPETYWIRGDAQTGTSTGFFALQRTLEADETFDVQAIGEGVATNRKFLEAGCLIRFVTPDGTYLDRDRTLKTGTPSSNFHRTEIWASINEVIDDGTATGNGWLSGSSGPGPVTLTENLPTGMLVAGVYAKFETQLITTLRQTVTQKIINNENFALRYDITDREWKIVNPLDIKIDGSFDITQTGNTDETGQDGSWMVLMSNIGNGRYIYYNRTYTYFFGSELETRFYFDPTTRVYDSRNLTTVKDQVRILTANNKPDSDENLDDQVTMEIYNTVDYSDGYKDDTKVKVTNSDLDSDGVPDDPSVFDVVVAPTVNSLNKLVFFKQYLDFGGFERFAYFDSGSVTTSYATLEDISENGRFAHPVGTVFYAFEEQAFYLLELVLGERIITATDEYIARVGRDKIHFQYRHNAPNNKRIDPSSSNIIDMYVLSESYDKSYRTWLKATTGDEPATPTLTELSLSYQELEKFKSVSDTITYSPGKYKALFGDKAPSELQATFKLVKSPASRLSDSEIKSRIVLAIDEYFALENWDFGEVFYFSELSAYLHQELRGNLDSVVLVPKNSTQDFGDLFQITCEPNEIFVSAATVNDIDMVDAITATMLSNQIQTSVFGGFTPESLRDL